MTETFEAWWFAASDVLPHGDGRKVILGETLRVEPPLVMCERGLHWSRDPFDALEYAPGPMLYKVRVSGEVIEAEAGDKGCSTERTALAVRDATAMLRLFARRQVLSVIHLWDAPQIVRDFLETGDETLRATAEAAAEAAASSVARAASSVARAARDATRAATWAAARAGADAAWAAEAAASSVAWADAWAASSVTWAARDATRAATRQMFNEMVTELFAAEELMK